MSIRAIQWVWDCSRAEGTDLLVFLALADFADGNGEAWPHQDLLAQKSRISLRTVQRSIEKLIRLEEVQVLRTARGNRYKLPMRQSDVTRHSYDVSDTSDCHVRSDKGDVSDTSTVAVAYEPSRTVNEPKGADASLGKSKAGDRPQPTWVRPTNFVEDLDQLPENQVEPLTDETRAAALERLRLLKGGQP